MQKRDAVPQEECGQVKRKARRKGHGWSIVLLSLLLVLALAAGLGYGVFHHYFSMLGRVDEGFVSDDPVTAQEGGLQADGSAFAPEAEEEPEMPPASEKEMIQIENDLQKNLEEMESVSDLYETDAFNILLIGVDSRSDSMSGRSDSMILVSIDKKTKQVVMSSFLRDIYLSIPGHGSDRLNAAYAYGGTELLVETIRANFGIVVDRCAVVNFYLVMDLVDALGGIDLELSEDEIGVMVKKYISGQNKLLGNPPGTDYLTAEDAGTVHVNGNQALAYTRVRYVGTDFARTGRQRTVIQKCLEQIKKMDLGEISALAEEFLPRVRTNLTEGDCAALLLMALNLPDYEFSSFTVPMDGTWKNANISGKSVLLVDFSANAAAWYEKVAGEE